MRVYIDARVCLFVLCVAAVHASVGAFVEKWVTRCAPQKGTENDATLGSGLPAPGREVEVILRHVQH